jgi:ribosomal protein L40E
MFVTQCPLCEHVNPERSKFCNVCGVSLLRVGVCARCGALNELAAAACHQCAAVLVERGRRSTDESVAAEPATGPQAAAASRPAAEAEAEAQPAAGPQSQPAAEPDFVSQQQRSPRRHRRLSTVQRALIAGTALSAVVGAFGYFTYSQSSVVDVSGLLPAAADDVRVVGGLSNARAALLNADVVVTADDPPPSVRLGSGTAQAAQSCTAAVSALGLCAFEPAQTKE